VGSNSVTSHQSELSLLAKLLQIIKHKFVNGLILAQGNNEPAQGNRESTQNFWMF
jgi:hypothetical protein